MTAALADELDDGGEPSTRRGRLGTVRRPRGGLLAGIALLALLAASALVVGLIRPFSATQVSGMPFSAPNRSNWLGTDQLGRDLFVRVCVAARTSLTISFLATLLAAIVGSAIGLTAGVMGGRVESALMAIIDMKLAIPSILLALSAATAFGPSMPVLVLVLGLIAVAHFARLVRARCAELRQLDFVQSARVSDVSSLRIALRHMLPNCQTVIAVQFANTAAITILLESAMSYLGLSVQPPTPSWGRLVFEAQTYMSKAPWLAVGPFVAILLASVAWGLIGESFSSSRRSIL